MHYSETEYILACQALNRTCGQEGVDWALSLLEQGYGAPSLCVLACMKPPYNSYEMGELCAAVLTELKIADISPAAALRPFAIGTIKAALSGRIELVIALNILMDLCIETNYHQ